MTLMDSIRILIADDQPAARLGLRALLQTWPDLEVVGEAEDSQAAVGQATRLCPDVVLMDVKMPNSPISPTASSDLGGLEATQYIKACLSGINVLMLTMFGTQREAAMSAGADGFLLKGGDPARLIEAIRCCAHRPRDCDGH